MKNHILLVILLLFASIQMCGQNPGGVEGRIAWNHSSGTVKLTDAVGLTYIGVNTITNKKEQTLWSVGTDSITTLVQTTGRTADLRNSLFMNYSSDTLSRVRLYSYSTSRADCSGKTLYIGRTVSAALPTKNLIDSTREYVVYPRQLSSQERSRVESYLALKYGITISHSYLNSHGTVVWDTNKMKKYGSRITGLIRDTSSALYSRTAVSSEDGAFLTFHTVTLAEGSSLLCGDNNGNLAFVKDNHGGKWLSRRWASVAVGDVFDTVSITASVASIQQITPITSGEYYYLAVDNSGTGKFPLSGIKYYKASTTNTDSITFSDVILGTSDTGYTVFTMRTAKSMFTTIEVKQPEETGAQGKLGVLITGGIPPYTANLTSNDRTVYAASTSDSILTTSGLSDGTYTLGVKDKIGNTTTDNFTIVGGEIQNSDISDATSDIMVSASPNPSSDGYVRVQVEQTSANPLESSLYTSDGTKLASEFQSSDTYHSFRIYLPLKGTYILKIQAGEKIRSIKLMRK